MKIVAISSRVHRSVLKLATLMLTFSIGASALAAPYVPPSGLGAPGRRESAGTRGCGFGNPANLIALLPPENIGLTTEAYPRFYWYMPLSQAQFVEFSLFEVSENGEESEIYLSRFAVSGEAGIVSLQLPETASIPALEMGDRYRWQVDAYCNPQSESGDLQIQGWVQRQQPDADFAAHLDDASPSEQAALYAQNGVWFDAIEAYATALAANPQDAELQIAWAELLQSVELNRLSDQPFLIEK